MFQSLKVVGVCAVLLGVECSDAMQIEEQEQSSELQKVNVEIGSPEAESLIVTEENLQENIEQEVINPWEDVQNHPETEEAISENTTEDPTDTGVVLSDTEEVVQQPENSTEYVNPGESAPAESIAEPENVNPIEEVQNPEEEPNTEPENVNPIEENQNSEETTSGEVDLGEPSTVPATVNPIEDQIPTESTTEAEETASPTEDVSLIGSSPEVGEVNSNSGIESGSESEYRENISVRIVKILTVIKDKSLEFLRRIFNLFF